MRMLHSSFDTEQAFTTAVYDFGGTRDDGRPAHVLYGHAEIAKRISKVEAYSTGSNPFWIFRDAEQRRRIIKDVASLNWKALEMHL